MGLRTGYPPYMPGNSVQIINSQTGAVATCAGIIPQDDTIPQNTEGTEVMTLAITPNSITNKLKIDVVCHCVSSNTNVRMCAALFQDDIANALRCMVEPSEYSSPGGSHIVFTHYMVAGTISEIMFKIRLGSNSGTTYFNGDSSGRKYGGVLASSITITEIKA